MLRGMSVVAFAVLAGVAQGASPWKEVLSFQIQTNVSIDSSVFVIGDHPDLGSWTVTGAIQLAYATGDVWSGQVAVRAGANVEYRFISRLDDATLYCEATNIQWLGAGNLTTSTPPQEVAPYAGKTCYYVSSWTSAYMQVALDATNVVSTNLDRVGAGRVAGEFLYRATGVGEEGDPLQFSFYGYLSETQYWDHAPYGGYGSNDYYTPLDVFYVQDGDVFSYTPPPAPSAATVVTQTVSSSYTNIPSRSVRVYLPRGYSDNTWKRYPVLYAQDGQYVASSWGAWSALTREIGQGRMREAIVVAVEAGNRCAEYTPPGEVIPPDVGCGSNEVHGIGDDYAAYVIHDVKGYVDANYRTLSDPPQTGVLGSSLGGLISAWMTLRTNVFGFGGFLSPSFWAANNEFIPWLLTNDTHTARIYVDVGTAEPPEYMWGPMWYVRYKWLHDGYAEGGDLLTVVGCGQNHNEPAWSNRLPRALRFLLSLQDEPNWLAQAEYPPILAVGVDAESAPTSFVHRTLGHYRYRLEVSTGLTESAWMLSATSGVEQLPWAHLDWSLTNLPAGDATFFRIVAEP